MTKRAGDENQPTIEIFRAGRHRAMNGVEISFSEGDLAASAAAYDPAIHEAPIVIGHPKQDAPAYGWISGLAFAEGALAATPKQLEPQFTEMVAAGRFKKVSASFYPPDASQNPVPGTFYLKHVGFLGAAAPSVKGLKQAEFADDSDAVTITLDFADAEMETGWALKRVFRIFRQLREYLIETVGQEKADKIIDGWDLDAGTEEAANVMDEARDEQPNTYSEPEPKKETTMKTSPNTPEEMQAREQALKDREAAFAEREADARRAGIAAHVDTLISAGKLRPAEKARVVQFMEQLDHDKAISFGEGDGAAEQTPLDFFKAFLDQQPAQVEFAEVAGQDNALQTGTAAFVAPPGYTVDQASMETHAKAIAFAEKNDVDYMTAVKSVGGQ